MFAKGITELTDRMMKDISYSFKLGLITSSNNYTKTKQNKREKKEGKSFYLSLSLSHCMALINFY